MIVIFRCIFLLLLFKAAFQLIFPVRYELLCFGYDIPYSWGVGNFFYSLLHTR